MLKQVNKKAWGQNGEKMLKEGLRAYLDHYLWPGPIVSRRVTSGITHRRLDGLRDLAVVQRGLAASIVKLDDISEDFFLAGPVPAFSTGNLEDRLISGTLLDLAGGRFPFLRGSCQIQDLTGQRGDFKIVKAEAFHPFIPRS